MPFLADVVATTTQNNVSSFNNSDNARRRSSVFGKNNSRRKSLHENNNNHGIDEAEKQDVLNFLTDADYAKSHKEGMIRSKLLYREQHEMKKTNHNTSSLHDHQQKPMFAPTLFLVPQNNVGEGTDANNHQPSVFRSRLQQQQQQQKLFPAVDLDGFAKAMKSELENLRDTSDLVFTKKKQQEDALAEKRRRNGLMIAKIEEKDGDGDGDGDGDDGVGAVGTSMKKNHKKRSNLSNNRGAGLIGGRILLGAASSKNLAVLRQQQLQEATDLSATKSFALRRQATVARIDHQAAKNSPRQNNNNSHSSFSTKNNNNNNNSNNNRKMLKLSTEIGGEILSSEKGDSDNDDDEIEEARKPSKVSFMKKKRNRSSKKSLLRSASSLDDSDEDDGETVKKSNNNNSFHQQLINNAKKFDDFFFRQTVTTKISNRKMLRILLKRASLKPSSRGLVEKLLFSRDQEGQNKLFMSAEKVDELLLSTDNLHGSFRKNNNNSNNSPPSLNLMMMTVKDPDVESKTIFANHTNTKNQSPQKQHNANDDELLLLFNQRAPSSSLLPAMESCLELLDVVVYQLDRPWLDAPMISAKTILPLNQFWRDLHKYSSDLMENDNNYHRDDDDAAEEEKFVNSRARAMKLNGYRDKVRAAREVATILVCLGVILQHRRRYVAAECEKVRQAHQLSKERKQHKNLTGGGENDGNDGKTGQEQHEAAAAELKIPRYTPNMALGLAFLLSTSAGVLQGEGAARIQLEQLFPGIALEGLCVDEYDPKVKDGEDKKLQAIKMREEQGRLLLVGATGDPIIDSLTLEERKAMFKRAQELEQQQQEKNDHDDDNNDHQYPEKHEKNDNRIDDDHDHDEGRSRKNQHFLSSRYSSSSSSSDDGAQDQVHDENYTRQQNHDDRKSETSNPQHHDHDEHRTISKLGKGTLLPIPKPKNLHHLFENQQQQFVPTLVGIRSHQRTTLLPISAFHVKSRQQLEAERAGFLKQRKVDENTWRNVERAFDRYLLQSRQVELCRSDDPMERERTTSSPGSTSLLRISSDEKNNSHNHNRNHHHHNHRRLLVTASCQPKSIFLLPQYTNEYPRESRRHLALEEEKEEDEDHDKKVMVPPQIFAPLTPLLFIENRKRSPPVSTPDEKTRKTSPLKIMSAASAAAALPLPILKTEEPDFTFFMTQNHPVVSSLTPNPSKNSNQKMMNKLKKLQFDSPSLLPPINISSSKTPQPKSSLQELLAASKKNENRIYSNRRTRTMWGVSPSFEVAASSVSRSLQLKPSLQ